MYFNGKKNNQFNRLFSKGWLLLVIIGLVILVVGVILFIKIDNTKYSFSLLGDDSIVIYQGTDYIEPGYQLFSSKNENLSDKVIIKSTLDTSLVGEYEIVYMFGDLVYTRRVSVIEKPLEYPYFYLTPVDNSVNIYLKLNDVYNDPGYKVYNSNGLSLSDKVSIVSNVDTSKKGIYRVVYSVIDSNGVTISASRLVIVMDAEISLSLDTKEYTNKNVTINIGVVDDYFDYILLPNNEKVKNATYSYSVSQNGNYTFKVYNTKSVVKEQSIQVSNIDKVAPMGSCGGNYGNGSSIINISVSDVSGISKYVYDGKVYTSNKIKLNKDVKNFSVLVYDNAGNSNTINCDLRYDESLGSSNNSDNNNLSSKITFNYSYIKEEGYIPYALYTPSSANNGSKVPLIIWLHGNGNVAKTEANLNKEGMPYFMNNLKLDGFHAYVLCLHLTGKYLNTWHNETSRSNLKNIINKLIREKNVDPDKIIISGHSMGGQGALYMAAKDNDFYDALVVYSGYYPQTPITGITIRAKEYVGNPNYGEDYESVLHMKKFFVPQFGEESFFELDVSHGQAALIPLLEDLNKDNKSDLIEWMLNS